MKPIKATAVAVALLAAATALAQGPIAYPAAGQNAAQQTQDHGECRAFATRSTGINSADLASSPSSGDSARESGERIASTARGAGSPPPVGDLGRVEAERAAQIGAAVAAENRQASPQGAPPSEYYRAYATCMERRGYALK
jgi:hypothetical protein